MKRFMTIFLGIVLISACHVPPPSPPPSEGIPEKKDEKKKDDVEDLFSI